MRKNTLTRYIGRAAYVDLGGMILASPLRVRYAIFVIFHDNPPLILCGWRTSTILSLEDFFAISFLDHQPSWWLLVSKEPIHQNPNTIVLGF